MRIVGKRNRGRWFTGHLIGEAVAQNPRLGMTMIELIVVMTISAVVGCYAVTSTLSVWRMFHVYEDRARDSATWERLAVRFRDAVNKADTAELLAATEKNPDSLILKSLARQDVVFRAENNRVTMEISSTRPKTMSFQFPETEIVRLEKTGDELHPIFHIVLSKRPSEEQGSTAPRLKLAAHLGSDNKNVKGAK